MKTAVRKLVPGPFVFAKDLVQLLLENEEPRYEAPGDLRVELDKTQRLTSG